MAFSDFFIETLTNNKIVRKTQRYGMSLSGSDTAVDSRVAREPCLHIFLLKTLSRACALSSGGKASKLPSATPKPDCQHAFFLPAFRIANSAFFLEVVSKPLNVIQHAREDDRTFKELGDCLMRSHNAFTFFVLFVRFVRFVVAILFQNFKRGNHESSRIRGGT